MAKHFPTHTPKTNPEYNHTKVTKMYDKYKNERKNEDLEKLYRKQQKEFKKTKK